ncbi:TonB-dependent receptor [Luteolibacter ambystomatis]|uniref:TonB-dependent receptor n=1 Tax=Luteolibacter ambystomatis TaxID=2824561 RepID=A0A975PH77_9BACT|nr:TonB-dependent receptor [Luteolibacter ambystomatis]QUE53052.1 TonB-dependent receptor [Luteolibacter ambystomatis]
MKSTHLIAAASICGLASAETTPEAASNKTLPDVVVTATKEKSLTAPSVQAAREELAKVPGGTEVVDADRYLRGRASTVADTFALSPGVFAQSRFGSDEARISIRGSGLQRTFHGRGIRVMQDGIPVNLADGSFDMQALEPTAASYINIWRGANALDQGSSTLGGAIDYVSRTGLNSTGGDLRVEAGSYGYLRAGIAGGFSAGSADVYASLTHQQQDGFRNHAEQENERLFTNFGWRFNDDVETRFYITAVNTNSELPGSLLKSELNRDPRMAAPANITLDQHRNFELLRLANKTTVRDGDTTWEFIAGVSHKDLDHPISTVIDQNTNDFFAGFTGTNESELYGHANRLRGGITFSYGLIDASTYASVFGHRGALTNHADQTATNLEGFIEDQFTVSPGFTLIAGASAAYNRRESDITYGPGRDYATDYTNISPKVGFRWEPTHQVQVYGNVSGSYEPPSFSEALTLNTARDAQTATTVELGTRGSWCAFRWDASVYHAVIKDELLSLVDPVTQLTSTINADKTLHSGIEAGFEGDLLGTPWDQSPDNRLVFRTAWTYGDFRFDNDAKYGNNKIAGQPPHLIRGELTWENHSGWYAGPTFEWVPTKAFIDHRNTFAADPYAICGFKFGQRREQGLSWFIEARNLTNEKYATTTGVMENANFTDQRQFLPGDGRSLYGGIEWKW